MALRVFLLFFCCFAVSCNQPASWQDAIASDTPLYLYIAGKDRVRFASTDVRTELDKRYPQLLFIEWTPSAAMHFTSFTQRHVGDRIALVFGQKIGTIVRQVTPILSGSLRMTSDENSVLKAMKQALDVGGMLEIMPVITEARVANKDKFMLALQQETNLPLTPLEANAVEPLHQQYSEHIWFLAFGYLLCPTRLQDRHLALDQCPSHLMQP